MAYIIIKYWKSAPEYKQSANQIKYSTYEEALKDKNKFEKEHDKGRVFEIVDLNSKEK
jgi:hypothetical protein